VAGIMLGTTAVRQFERAQERIGKAICRLGDAVEHIKRAFDPVLSPEGGPMCPTGCDKEPTPPQSEFERFVAETESRIHTIAQAIDSICERSSV
jgi:hypothetical protein